MSLIQDALKRQQEEMNKTAPTPLGKLDTPAVPPPPPIQSKIPLRMMGQPKPEAPPSEPPKPPAPSTPPPAPNAKADTAPRVLTHRKTGSPESPPEPPPLENKPGEAPLEPQAEKRNQTVLAVLLILLLVLGIGFYFAWPLLSTPKPEPAPGSAAPVIPVVATAPEVPAVPEVTPVATPSNGPTSPVPDNIAAPATAATTSAPPSSGEAIVSSTSATTSVAGTPPPTAPETASILEVDETVLPADGAAPETQAAPVVWPPIKLTGLVKLGATAAALINGKVVAPGDTIEGVSIKSVTKEGAWVRFTGEERLLRVGETAR